MRRRRVSIPFRLTEKEAEQLNNRVKRSGLTREAYLRHLICDRVPKDTPPPDYYSMMTELHRIGNNLNQIARKAHAINVIDVKRYDEAVKLFQNAVERITEAVILPEDWRRIERLEQPVVKNENR